MRVLLVLTLLLSLVSFSVAQYQGYCGSQIGYNLTSILGQGIHVFDGYNAQRLDYHIYPCESPQGIATSCRNNPSPISGCAISTTNTVTQTYGNGMGYSANTWSFVNTSDYLQGFTWSTPYISVPSTYIFRRAQVKFTCHADAINPWISYGGTVSQVVQTNGYQEYHTVGFSVISNIFCNGSALNSTSGLYTPGTGTALSSNSSVTSSTAVNLSFQSSSGGVIVPNTTGSAPGCSGSSLLSWSFSYFAIVSSTYSIQFSGTYYTASIASNLLVSQLWQIQATWTLITNGVSINTPVTVLNPQIISSVNTGGGPLYPLQGQSWSFYVGTELVTLAGNGSYPIIVNGQAIQSGGIIVSSTPIGSCIR